MHELLRDIWIIELIRNALEEDIGSGDVTTNAIVTDKSFAKASLIAKENGILAGVPIFEMVFKELSDNFKFNWFFRDGDHITTGDVLVEFTGDRGNLLSGERTALNFLQRMSGIATKTNQYMEIIRASGVQLLDTRKTVPGWRTLDKYAVRTGGGKNHRQGLFDMALIKENHITLAGGITAAVERVKSIYPNIQVEVETRNLEEVREALNTDVDMIMLDNMDLETMAEAVKTIGGKVRTEASGNVTAERLGEIAGTGVDFISSGSLTHSVQALDISMIISE